MTKYTVQRCAQCDDLSIQSMIDPKLKKTHPNRVWRADECHHDPKYRHTCRLTSSNVYEIELTTTVASVCAGIAAAFGYYTPGVSTCPGIATA